MPSSYFPGSFEIEHIIAKQHGGQSIPSNLAYACLLCNRRKGPNLAGIDRIRSRIKLVPLFNPRRHTWAVHFRWSGGTVVGRTAIGRVTVAVLGMNEGWRVAYRESLMHEGLPPPAG